MFVPVQLTLIHLLDITSLIRVCPRKKQGVCSCTTVSTVSFGPYEQHPLELHEVAIVGSGVSSFSRFADGCPCVVHDTRVPRSASTCDTSVILHR